MVHFTLSFVPAVVLKAVLEDPLQAAGWLHTVSEMGGLLTLAADTNDEGDESDEDDDILHGDSDDGDFAQEQLEDDLNGHGGLGNFPDGVGLQIGEMLAHMPLGEILGAAPMDGSSDDEHMADYPLIYD